MRDGYSVMVLRYGEPLVTIESTMLSGQSEFSEDDAQAIRDAGWHLLSFIGPKVITCFACGGVDKHQNDCPLRN